MNNFFIKEISNKNEWTAYSDKNSNINFLHSWNWGEFQENLGKKIGRYGLFLNNIQVGCFQYVVEDAKRGRYLAIAGGPVVDWDKISQDNITQLWKEIKIIAIKYHCVFIRLRLQDEDSEKLRIMMKKSGFIFAPMHLTADLTHKLDLTLSEEEILKNMRKTTRYEIRKAEREGIKIEFSKNLKDLKDFYGYQIELSKKHRFIPFSYEFLLKQFEAFLEDEKVVLIHAKKNTKLLSSAFVIFSNNEAVYHYGISTPENNKYSGSYLCQWAAIKEAKQRNCKSYNFWGVSPIENNKHRFAGVSLFKRGFGGEDFAYLATMDLPVSWKYIMTWFFESIRKKIRHL
ncbi:MAG: peptidoglycan bridge formation glycyltransferase FemA/FemB family protein [Patescibacteria group bacterium]